MATRAVPQVGALMKVTLATTRKIFGAGTYSLSGFTRKTIETSEFGDDVDVFEFSTADGGTISVNNVVYDPTDTTGQLLMDSAALNSSKFSSGEICFFVNSTQYFTPPTGSYILITKVQAIEADRNGLGRCSFEGQVSGAALVLL